MSEPTTKTHKEAIVDARLSRIDALARSLDSKYRIPFTRIRIGWDGIIGLIPGIGDTITFIPQLYLLFEGFRAKVGFLTLLRMLLNVGIDWLVGLIPIVGDFFDIAFRSNQRNAKLVADKIRQQTVV